MSYIIRTYVTMSLIVLLVRSGKDVAEMNTKSLLALRGAYEQGRAIISAFPRTWGLMCLDRLIKKELQAIETLLYLVDAFASAFGGVRVHDVSLQAFEIQIKN